MRQLIGDRLGFKREGRQEDEKKEVIETCERPRWEVADC